MTREDRGFVLTVGSAFVALAAVLAWRGHSAPAAACIAAAVALALIGIIAPGSVAPVRRTWMRGATAMSRVTTPIVLGVMYFVVLTPTGLIRRLLRRSSLSRARTGETAWVKRDTKHDRSDMRRQF